MSVVTSQSLSTALTVISANIEGLTAVKASILSEMCKRECHCLCLQETHRSTNLPRPKIDGMSLVVEPPHNKYGSAILIRNDLKVKKIYDRVQGTFEIITIVMSGVVVHSVYKSPNDSFELPALDHTNLPHIVIGDFNGHSTTWGYASTDNEGEAVEQWADSCDFTLIHDAKLPKSFNSARWKKGYNPDLIFASDSFANMCKKSVMDPIPHTVRHRSAVEPLIIAKDRKTTLQAIHTMAVNQAVTSLGRNVVLDDRPPAINISEKELTRMERTTLAQLRSVHCILLSSHKSRISKDVSLDVFADCGKTPHDVKHLFNCPAHSTTMTPMEQTCGRNQGNQLETEILD